MFPNTITTFVLLFFAATAIAQPGHSTYRDTFCDNQTILVGNQFFNANNPTGTVILPGAAVGGIDSVIHVELTFNSAMESTLNQTLCEGDTLWVNGTAYHAGFYIGDEFIESGSANGCDSIIVTNINVVELNLMLGNDTIIQNGDSLRLNPLVNSQNALSWKWSPPTGLSCADCKMPIATPLSNSLYQLNVKDTKYGCTATDDDVSRSRAYKTQAADHGGDTRCEKILSHSELQLKSLVSVTTRIKDAEEMVAPKKIGGKNA